jgi:hypothetical protein
VPVDSSRISFGEVQQHLREYGVNSSKESDNSDSIYYLISRDIDESGNASIWIFGVSRQSRAEFLIYEKTGWTSVPWNATLLSEAINLDTIVSPGSLLSQNKAVISGKTSLAIPERWDLELQRGIYTLTITSENSSRSLTFDAITGALIA